jgi:hypothetical protein
MDGIRRACRLGRHFVLRSAISLLLVSISAGIWLRSVLIPLGSFGCWALFVYLCFLSNTIPLHQPAVFDSRARLPQLPRVAWWHMSIGAGPGCLTSLGLFKAVALVTRCSRLCRCMCQLRREGPRISRKPKSMKGLAFFTYFIVLVQFCHWTVFLCAGPHIRSWPASPVCAWRGYDTFVLRDYILMFMLG